MHKLSYVLMISDLSVSLQARRDMRGITSAYMRHNQVVVQIYVGI